MSERIFLDIEKQITKVKKELNNLESMLTNLKQNYKTPVIESKPVVNNKNSHFTVNVIISKQLASLLKCSPKLNITLLTKNIVHFIKTNPSELSLLKNELKLSPGQDISFYNLQKVIKKNIN